MSKKNRSKTPKINSKTRKESKTFLENKWFAIGLIILVSAVIYYNSLNVPFILDDNAKIVKNPDIRKLDNIKTRLVYPYKEYKTFRRNDPSRPLTYLTYTLNYHFGKLNTFGYHLFDLIIHTCSAILIFFLTRKIIAYTYKQQYILFPLLVSLLFAVHPVNVSSVAYVYARGNVLAAFFYILSLLFFIKAFEKNKRLYFVSIFSFILSLFSKPLAVTLPFMILVFDYIFLSDYKIGKVSLRKYYHILMWSVLVFYLCLRYLYIGGIGDMEAEITWSRYSYTIVQPYVILRYLKLLIIPSGFSIDHLVMPVSIFEFKILASFLILIGVCILMYKMYRKKNEISKISLFCFLWFFITLSPTSSFFPTADAMVERRIYLAEFGFFVTIVLLYFLIFCRGVSGSRSNIWILLTLAGIHISVLSIATVKRNQLFQNPVLLWQDVISKYPGDYRAHHNLGTLYKSQKEYAKAIKEYQKVLKIKPDDADAHNSLGILYYEQKEYAKAIEKYQKALEINPDYAESHRNLGLVYKDQKEYSKAIEEFQKALEINPDYTGARNNLAILYCNQKEYTKAIEEFQKALEINPDYAEAHYNLGFLYKEQKEYVKAIKEFQKAIQINPAHAGAHYNLGNLYYSQKDYRRALQEFEYLLKLNPDDKNVEINIKKLKRLLE